MTPERIARLVALWVRLYTWSVPAPVAERRAGEIVADLEDHMAHGRARGMSDRRIALSMLGRMLRGLGADVAWRGRWISRSPTRSMIRVAIVTACILVVPLIANQFTDGEGWKAGDFLFAGVLLGGTGLLFELAVRRPRNVVARAVISAIGVAAIMLGEADDARGLVVFGCAFGAGAVALSLRPARRSE